MSKYAVRQPNGLFCYFADSSWKIWAYNMTFEQLVQYNAKMWGKTLEQAERDMKYHLDNHLYTWDEMLEWWMWRDDEILELMRADPSTVDPCYDAQ